VARRRAAGGAAALYATHDAAEALAIDWARLGGADHPDRDGDLPGAITEIRFRGPHTDYHLDTPAGRPARGAGPCSGPG
jgi:hypothetical protein